MDNKIENLISVLAKRNITGQFFKERAQANEEILFGIPLNATVGFSGSVTLDEMGIIKQLEARGSKVFNQYKAANREEGLALRRQGSQADYFLTSANAISEKGELVFFSGYGHRIAGISGAGNCIVVAGVNKVVADKDEALKRAREFATPKNCKRLNWNSACFADGICHEEKCLFPEFKRMCCQILIIEAEVAPGRLKVILVGEDLGF